MSITLEIIELTLFLPLTPINQREKKVILRFILMECYMMENRTKYIQDLLDKGIIRYKENSESIYYDTSIFDNKK